MSVDQFRGGELNTEVIINLMIPKKLFQWVDDGEEYKFEGLVDVRVFINGETAAQDVFRILEKSVDRPGPNERLISMVQQSRFLLSRGSVVFTATITDLSSKQVYVSTKNVIIRKINDSYLSTSDLLLCTFLKREKEFDEGSINRNGFTIAPNPIELPLPLLSIILSKPAKAPPQINRMFVVSTCKNSQVFFLFNETKIVVIFFFSVANFLICFKFHYLTVVNN